MVEALAAIAQEVVPDNRFLGESELAALRAELEQLDLPVWSARRFDLAMRAAVLELRMGRTGPALDDLEFARSLLPELDADARPRSEVAVLFGLGLARVRQGENDNCVACASPDMCQLPIREGGLHLDQTGSRAAMEALLAVLRHEAAGEALRLKARWLLNIAAMTVGEWPDGLPPEFTIPPETFASDEPFPRFANLAASVGLDTFNLSGGAVVDDLDGDGRLDVLTSTWDYEGPMHLHRNAGDGTFVDVADEWGLAGLTGGLNMIHADVDDDGDADVLVLRGAWFDVHGRHPNSLLRNDGGRFTDVTEAAGLLQPAYPTQTAAFADYDLDGDLDLYVGNEATARRRYAGQLFRNDGVTDGVPRFTDVAAQAGVENLGYAKGVAWGDYDDDGWPDLYVSNFGGDNRLYRNRGDGTFEDVAPRLGVTAPQMSFPCWFWDVDDDGHLDLYVAAYVEEVAEVAASYLGQRPAWASHEPGRLYRNDGQGGFEDVSEAWGLTRLVTTMGANFGDIDDDGRLDMYLGTGYPSYEALVPNVLYRNVRGTRFADVSADAGMGHLQKGHAIAFADVDDDGDQDVFEQMGGAYRGDGFHDALYENPGFGRHWLRLELEGVASNRSALGARVTAEIVDPEHAAATGGDGRRRLHRTLGGGGSFGSNPLHVHLGLGGAARLERLEVRWPGGGGSPDAGTIQVFSDVAVDRIVALREGDDALVTVERPPITLRRP